MKTNKKFPQEASSENLNNIEIFLSKEDNQFYYLDRNRKPVKLIPETNIITDNTTITGSGTEEDPLVVTGGSGATAKELNLIYDAPNFLMTEVSNTLGVTRVGFSTSSAGAGLGIVDFFWTNELDVSKMIIQISSSIPTIGTPPFNYYGVTTKTATGFQIKIFDSLGVLAANGVYDITLKYFG